MTEQRKTKKDVLENEKQDSIHSKTRRPYNRNSKNNLNEKKEVKERIQKEKVQRNERSKKIEDSKDTVKPIVSKRNYNKKQPKFEFKKSNLKVIPLGGLEEIGNNMTIFEYEDEIIVYQM